MLDSIFRHNSKTLHVFRIFDFVAGRRASKGLTGLSRLSSRGAKFLGGELLEASGSDTADSLIELQAEPLDLNINLDLGFGGAGAKNPESAAAGA